MEWWIACVGSMNSGKFGVGFLQFFYQLYTALLYNYNNKQVLIGDFENSVRYSETK